MSINQENIADTFVLLSVGSNLGDRKANITNAVELLQSSMALHSIKMSSLYETEPVGLKDQPWFINAAISGYTKLPVNLLIEICKSIEYSLGRQLRKKWSLREIDIDILLYGDCLLESESLTVPHERMHERRFVLKPAAEIAGEAIHPKFGISVGQLLSECPDMSEVNFSS